MLLLGKKEKSKVQVLKINNHMSINNGCQSKPNSTNHGKSTLCKHTLVAAKSGNIDTSGQNTVTSELVSQEKSAFEIFLLNVQINWKLKNSKIYSTIAILLYSFSDSMYLNSSPVLFKCAKRS